MDSDLVIHLGRRALETALLIAAPVLVVSVVVGVLVAMLQAVTSIRDMTLGVAIKLGAVGIALLFSGNWMMHMAIDFTSEIFGYIQDVGGAR